MSNTLIWVLFATAAAVVLGFCIGVWRKHESRVQRLFVVAAILLSVGYGILTHTRGYGFFSDGYGWLILFLVAVALFALWMDARRKAKLRNGESV